MRFITLSIGDVFQHSTCPDSTVAGIDHYQMKSFSGKKLEWTSYTLVSDQDDEFARWWLVNMPEVGPCMFLPTDKIPDTTIFQKDLSGLVLLDSEGDAAMSSNNGAAAIYFSGNGDIFAEEVFDNEEIIRFKGRQLHF